MNQYTPEQKAQALHLFRAGGAPHAAKVLGIPEGTVRRWASEAGERTPLPQNGDAGGAATAMKWADRRECLAHEVGRVAALALEATRKAIDDGKLRDAASGTTAFGTLVDKAQLLSGGATSRQAVNPDELVAKARENVVKLVPQRKAG